MTTTEYSAWLNQPRADDPAIEPDDDSNDPYAPQTDEERREYDLAYAANYDPADPDGARWMAMGWDARAGEWVR